MTVVMIGIIGVIAMFSLMFLRIPIAISLALPAIIGIWYLNGTLPLFTALSTIVWDHTASYNLSTIPMFVLMGELLLISGISNEVYNMLRAWIGRFRSGLGVSTIGASALFASVTGSSLATVGTIGPISFKEMVKSGYDKSFSSGTIVAGGTLGILIPPSTTFIIYGIITETSIGQLFMAGVIPGIVLTLLYMLTVWVTVLFRDKTDFITSKSSWSEKFTSLKSIIWVIILIIIVIGGMYFGIFGPTEAGGVGAFGAFVIALVRRKLTVKNLFQALFRTLKTTSFLFAIIIGAFILNYFLVLTKITDYLTNFLMSLELSAVSIILIILLMYLILGAIMDSLAMILITIPLILPTLEALNIDLIWFGVLIVISIEMALITPPIGMNSFVLKGVLGNEVELGEIFKGALWFLIPIFVLVFLLILFPELALLLPYSM